MALSKIEVLRKIVRDRQCRKVKGKNGMIMMDSYTASLLTQLYDKLTKDESIIKFETASWEALANFVYKKMGA